MKLKDLIESPITDYKELDHNKSSQEYNKMTKDMRKGVKEFDKALKKIDSLHHGINLYVLKTSMVYDDTFNILWDRTTEAGSNYAFYIVSNNNRLRSVFGEDIASSIKSSDNTITVIFVLSNDSNVDAGFKFTSWKFVHDFVHAIATSNKDAEDHLNSIEFLLDDLVSSIREERGFERYSKTNLIEDIFTMGSAKNGALRERPQESVVELFTQYVYNGNIKFAVPRVLANRHDIVQQIEDVRVQIKSILDYILDGVQGKICLVRV